MSTRVHFSTIILISSLWLLDANCNLLHRLYNNDVVYINTESETSILTMCERDLSQLSLWEQYQCEYIENRNGVTTCWPQRRMSYCQPGNLKGVIFLYHGFSACPNYYNEFAEALVVDCWHVYQLLLIGHGYNYCDDDPSCLWGKYNVSQLPTSREPYIEYVKMMNNIIKNEVFIVKECEVQANSLYNIDNMEVVVGGLSFGAPLAAASVLLSGEYSVFTKQLIMSPEFIGDIRSFGFSFYNCLANGSVWECFGSNKQLMQSIIPEVDSDVMHSSYSTFLLILNGILEWLVETQPKTQIVKDLLNSNMIWDESRECEDDIKYRDRGGFCVFGVDQFLATISFAKYVMQSVTEIDKVYNDEIAIESLLILSERDGLFWNSFSMNYVRMFYSNNDDLLTTKADNCMWLIAAKCKSDTFNDKIDNICGVPHSFMSEAANLGDRPYYLYWREQTNDGILSWMNNNKLQINNFMVPINKWDESRNQCVEFDFFDPPIQFAFVKNELRDKIIKFYNVDYSKLLSQYFTNSTYTDIDQIISDFMDKLDISVNVLALLKMKTEYKYSNINNKIMHSIQNNYEIRYWLWKLFDIKINKFDNLSHLLDVIFLKLSGQNMSDKLMKSANIFEEIGYWYHKSMQVNINSVHDLSNFLNTITDELLNDDDFTKNLNGYKGLIKQGRRIIERIKQFKDTKQKKQKNVFANKDSIIMLLFGMNTVIITTFILYWLYCKKYSYGIKK